MKRKLLVAALALVLSACGGSSGREVLRDASANLGEIRSGVLHARFLVQPRRETGRQPFGFTIDGPFRLGGQPTANLTYVRIANGHRRSEKLAPSPEELRRTTRTVRALSAIVDVSSWVRSSESTDCPQADAPVECVKGDLDPVEALNGLLALEQAIGRGDAGLGTADAEQLRKAVRKATFFVMAGKDDKLLRDLRIDLTLAHDVPEELRGFLGRLVGADVRFELGVDRPNAAG